jgi:hypothetical protein
VSIATTLFFLLFLSIGLAILAYGVHTWRHARRAARWPTVQGAIVHSELEVDSDSDSTTYRVKVKYAYAVGGRHYESDRIAIGYGSSSSRASHERLQAKLQGARKVAVHYDPAQPDQAVLGAVVTRNTLFLLLFGAIWTGFTIGLMSLFLLIGRADTKLLDSLIVH